MQTEAEISAVTTTQGALGPPEAGRGEEGPSLEPGRHLDSRPPAARCNRTAFSCLKLPVWGGFLQQPQDTDKEAGGPWFRPRV